jgi:CRISPR/Cas system-associated protein Csx1
MTSAAKWKAHTSTSIFATEFDKITNRYAADNELRSKKIEDFLIREAKKAEVIQSKRDKV